MKKQHIIIVGHHMGSCVASLLSQHAKDLGAVLLVTDPDQIPQLIDIKTVNKKSIEEMLLQPIPKMYRNTFDEQLEKKTAIAKKDHPFKKFIDKKRNW